jgi:phosphopantothenoylcysteine decarboxylase/phosphopantothenate--cysteine ligase
MSVNSLQDKRILLGVSGGIAAYKAAELARALVGAGAEVQVVMTEAATAFVGPLTFQALTGRAVRTALFDEAHEAAMGHIELARWADLILVAPASANTLARLANGLADDLLSTLCLASPAPLAVAPAMNQQMWRHPATAENISRLLARGVHVWGPASGEQACGDVGPGRMREPADLLADVQHLLLGGRLTGVKALVTAGPTREALDPVRFLGNRSSGKMGYAVAAALATEGAEVTLVSGPVGLATPRGVRRISVESAAQMHAAVMREVAGCTLFVACAAVADYRPAEPAVQKIKKTTDALSVALVKNPDILAEVAGLHDAPFTVGFAAETERLAEFAEAKRRAKGVDMIAANLVGGDLAFDTDDNALLVSWEGGSRSLPRTDKARLATQLVQLISERLHAQAPAEDPR